MQALQAEVAELKRRLDRGLFEFRPLTVVGFAVRQEIRPTPIITDPYGIFRSWVRGPGSGRGGGMLVPGVGRHEAAIASWQ